ncbi:MarR family winged helix-turn-helix transcriptional regulator, partial [Micromonospora sp. NPDC004336]
MTGDADAVEDGLAEAFRAVTRRLRHRIREALAPWDVTPGQARALDVLTRHGALRPSALAEHLRIAPRSATEVVDDDPDGVEPSGAEQPRVVAEQPAAHPGDEGRP